MFSTRIATVVLVLALFVSFFVALDAAQGHVKLELDPAGLQDADALARDQARVDAVLLPTPNSATPMRYEVNACGGRACAAVGGPIFIDPTGGGSPDTLLHELAHAAIDQHLTVQERQQWTALMHQSGMLPPESTEWWPTNVDGTFRRGETGAGELFADAWADCAARRLAPAYGDGLVATAYGYSNANPARNDLCRWLYDISVAKGWTGGESMEQRIEAVARESRERRCGRLTLIVRELRSDLSHQHKRGRAKLSRRAERRRHRTVRQIRRALVRRVAQQRTACW